MIQIIFGIIILIILVTGCYFVNDTKKKYGTCCGKGCPDCNIFEKYIEERNEKSS